MSGTKLMSAIGNIADRYVVECVDVSPRKQVKLQKYIPYMAVCLVVVICFASALAIITARRSPEKPIIDNNGSNVSTDKRGDIRAPIYFYLEGKAFVADSSMKIVTEVPDGYYYVGTVTDVGDTFSGKNLEGNTGGAVYLSQDGKTAYVQSSSLEKINGESPYILCIIAK